MQFLRDYYEHRKAHSSSFSYGLWAQELGLKSRSFLRLLLVGKRNLTQDTAEQIIQAMDFNQNESNYFRHLVGLSRSTTLESQERHSRELAKLQRKLSASSKVANTQELSKADVFDFLASYQIPRLQTLLGLKDIERTPRALAKYLGLSESEVREHLQTLSRLGLAVSDAIGQWRSSSEKISTSDFLGNVALQSFHRKSLEESIRAIALPKETRRFQSLVVPLTEEQFQEVHEELRDHLLQILNRFEATSGEGKKVYQLNLNLIPVTETILRKAEPGSEKSASVVSDGKSKGRDYETEM